jgi:hypothetical protein
MHNKAWINKGPCLSYKNIATVWIFFLHSSSSPHCYLSYSSTFAFICHMRGTYMRMEVALKTAVECTFSALRWVRLERLRHPPFWSTHVFNVRCLCLFNVWWIVVFICYTCKPMFLSAFGTVPHRGVEISPHFRKHFQGEGSNYNVCRAIGKSLFTYAADPDWFNT